MLNQHVFFLEDMPGARPRQSVVSPATQAPSQQEVLPMRFRRGVRRARNATRKSAALVAHRRQLSWSQVP